MHCIKEVAEAQNSGQAELQKGRKQGDKLTQQYSCNIGNVSCAPMCGRHNDKKPHTNFYNFLPFIHIILLFC